MTTLLDPAPDFRPLAGIFEPSAVVQLPDGRFLAAEDEKDHPFCLFGIGADGTITAQALDCAALPRLDDLEGLALDGAGRVVAITSHSRDGEGEEKKSRHRLVRFQVEGNRATAPWTVQDLKPLLAAADATLAAAAAVIDVKNEGGFNIEGLEWTPDGRELLVGFRGPVAAGQALVARIADPDALFQADRPRPPVLRVDRLDLDGDGIRGLSWIPRLNGYLVIGGPVAKRKAQFRLWHWSGQAGAPARPAAVEGVAGLEHAEGICPAVVDGRDCILVTSDDGDRQAGRTARYLLAPAQAIRTS